MARRLSYLAPLLAAWLLAAAPARADQYTDAADLFRNAQASGEFFDSSYGYAIFPTVGKGGFIIAGGYGRGRVFVAGDPVGDTTLVQGTIGLQVGGQAFTQIIFFQDERAFREFSSGSFEFGGAINATVINQSVAGTAGTGGATSGRVRGVANVENAGGFHKGMAVFLIATGGLMFEASVGGQRFSYSPIAQDLNLTAQRP